MPGGIIVGDDAGFLNIIKLKGTHTAIKSGTLAAEAGYEAIKGGPTGGEELTSFVENFEASWLYEELHRGRNTTAWMHKFGLLIGSAAVWIEQAIFR